VAYAARLALNSTIRVCEIKGLRWRDTDMFEQSLTGKKSKTEAGERVIPLNADAWEAILALYRRSQALRGFEPSHFLFPACENKNIDPTRPMKSWRTAWRRLTQAILCSDCGLLQNPGVKCSKCEANISGQKRPFASFRFHDLRHQAITELAESKASDQTIMSIAGHVSKKMLQHFSHLRLDAKRNALDRKPAPRSDARDTKKSYDTKIQREMEGMPQVADFMVELSGIEPLASSLRTRRSPS
jgi:integrase